MPDDYDTPWKDAVEHYFPEFMAFYFPAAHAAIDWTVPAVFLDQELAAIWPDSASSKRRVDKLAQVRLLDGKEEWVLAHVEVQSQRDSGFAERVFICNYRLYERHRRPVASLAVLADSGQAWRPSSFSYSVLECVMGIQFPVAKLHDHAGQIDELLASSNFFAWVTAAHLLTQQTRRKTERRRAVKLRLIRMLIELDSERRRIMDLLSVIDWMMRLPREVELELRRDVASLSQEKSMRYVTSWERFAKEEGLEEGLEKGRKEGREKGREEGRLQGRLLGQAELLERMLRHRFGELPPPLREKLGGASGEQLAAWSIAALTAQSLEQVFA